MEFEKALIAFSDDVKGYLQLEDIGQADTVDIPEPLLLLRKLRLYSARLDNGNVVHGNVPFLSVGGYEDQPYLYSRALELCMIAELEHGQQQYKSETLTGGTSQTGQTGVDPNGSFNGIAINPIDRIRGANANSGSSDGRSANINT